MGTLSRSELVLEAENRGKTLLEAYPDCEMAEEYRTLAEQILSACRRKLMLKELVTESFWENRNIYKGSLFSGSLSAGTGI